MYKLSVYHAEPIYFREIHNFTSYSLNCKLIVLLIMLSFTAVTPAYTHCIEKETNIALSQETFNLHSLPRLSVVCWGNWIILTQSSRLDDLHGFIFSKQKWARASEQNINADLQSRFNMLDSVTKNFGNFTSEKPSQKWMSKKSPNTIIRNSVLFHLRRIA